MATTGDSNTTDHTLHIRFREGSDHNLEDALAALDRGETPQPHLEVVYHDPAMSTVSPDRNRLSSCEQSSSTAQRVSVRRLVSLDGT